MGEVGGRRNGEERKDMWWRKLGGKMKPREGGLWEMGSPRLEKSGLPGNKAGHASSHGDQWRLGMGWTLRDGRMHCRQGGGLGGSSGVMVNIYRE